MTTLSVLPNLHHVGIVQPDMEAADEFIKLFGYEEDYRGFVESFQCWCIFLKAPAGASLCSRHRRHRGIAETIRSTRDQDDRKPTREGGRQLFVQLRSSDFNPRDRD